jgi:hypothetical protein
MPLESSQTSLQYFCFSAGIQLQAGCAHFFTSAISSPQLVYDARWGVGVECLYIKIV